MLVDHIARQADSTAKKWNTVNEIVVYGELLILIVPVNQSDSIMMGIKVVAHGMQFYFLIQVDIITKLYSKN